MLHSLHRFQGVSVNMENLLYTMLGIEPVMVANMTAFAPQEPSLHSIVVHADM